MTKDCYYEKKENGDLLFYKVDIYDILCYNIYHIYIHTHDEMANISACAWDFIFVGVYWISLVACAIAQATSGDTDLLWEAMLGKVVGPHFQKNI